MSHCSPLSHEKEISAKSTKRNDLKYFIRFVFIYWLGKIQ